MSTTTEANKRTPAVRAPTIRTPPRCRRPRCRTMRPGTAGRCWNWTGRWPRPPPAWPHRPDARRHPGVPTACRRCRRLVRGPGRERRGVYPLPRQHRSARAAGARISRLLCRPVDAGGEIILTPGTQGGLFAALSALVSPGDVVARRARMPGRGQAWRP